MSPRKITATMKRRGYDPEQLPELWQQLTDDDGVVESGHRSRWCDGVEAMYRRCETYLQYLKITDAINGIPGCAKPPAPGQAEIGRRGGDLLRQSAPEQLRQALAWAQQQSVFTRHIANSDILKCATVEQLTGPVIEQLQWNGVYADCGTPPGNEAPEHWRDRHIVAHIQQQLLGGDENAWNVFLGIVDGDTAIGDAAELARVIEQQDRPARTST